MKIVLTGGGTGGHFYPLIAVVEKVYALAEERKLVEPVFIHLGPEPFDKSALAEQNIEHRDAPAGRSRRYSSILNALDIFKTGIGIIKSIFQLYGIYPDVVFSTGGYAAFPTLVAARILAIPTVIYDADAEPGRVSLWSSHFAHFIAIAHPDAAVKFPDVVQDRIASTGHPIRAEIEYPASEGGHEFLKIDPSVPTIFVMGGSQGAETINNAILDALPQLIEKYNIIHQTGRDNLDEVVGVAQLIIKNTKYDNRYRAFGLLNTLALKMIAGVSNIVISRAGSGSIFEIAAWGIPSILIPIPLDVSHDQTRNAFSYARTSAAIVIEQQNLTPHILVAEIDRIMESSEQREIMRTAARAFVQKDSAAKIAKALVDVALGHTA